MNNITKGIVSKKIEWFPKEYRDGLDTVPREIYDIADRAGMNLQVWLETQKSKTDGKPTPYYGMTLEQIHRKRWALKAAGQEVPQRAFEMLFEAADIKAFGDFSLDTVDKFYIYSDTATLFPEYIADRVYAAKIKTSLVPQFVASTTVVNGNEVKKIMLDDTQADRQMAEVGKGTDIPIKHIKVGKHTLNLKKFAIGLSIAYEDIKWQRLNVLGITLDRIGLELGCDETDDLWTVAINGDGNSNTPATTVIPAVANTIEMADCLEWWSGLPSPYEMNKHVSRKAIKISYQAVLANLNISMQQFQANVGTAVPAYFEWDTSAITTGYFIGFDTRYALENFNGGAVMTESEKIMNKQLEQTYLSYWSANSVIDNNAIALWNTTSGG